jgi:hypothetical protein
MDTGAAMVISSVIGGMSLFAVTLFTVTWMTYWARR